MNPVEETLDAATQLKRQAGIAAAQDVETEMVVGLGTGSTVEWTIRELGRRVAEEGLNIVGIPTSVRSERLAQELGIPLSTLELHPVVDVTIDGADEVDPAFDLVKGGGGALTREKIVASASRRMVVVVDPSKLVPVLAQNFPLPVELVPMALPTARLALEAMGAVPRERKNDDETSYRTDNGMAILDCRFPDGIQDKPATEQAIDLIPGVLECGLFLGKAHIIVVGTPDGPKRLEHGQWLK